MKKSLLLSTLLLVSSAFGSELGGVLILPSEVNEISILSTSSNWHQVGGEYSSSYRVASPESSYVEKCKKSSSVITERLSAVAPNSSVTFTTRVSLDQVINNGPAYINHDLPEANRDISFTAYYSCKLTVLDPQGELKTTRLPRKKYKALISDAKSFYSDLGIIAVSLETNGAFSRSNLAVLSLNELSEK